MIQRKAEKWGVNDDSPIDKTAEEIVNNYPSVKIGIDDFYGKQTFIKAIEQAQKEAYNQAIEDATEKAKVSLFDWINDGFKEFKKNSNHYSINDGTYVKIDEQSILKLKK